MRMERDERELAVQRAKAAALEARIDELQAQLLVAETRAASLAGEAAEAERARAELELQLASTKDALEAAEEWIRTIHASKSWRVTTPLRRAAAAIRGKAS